MMTNDGEMEAGGAKILFSLHHVKSAAREILEQQPGDPGVDGAVADDENVQQALPQTASELQGPSTAIDRHETRG